MKLHRFLPFPLAAAVAVAAMLASPSAQATNYYWDTNGAPGFTNIVGAWNGTTTFWNTDIAGATSGTFIASPSNADDLSINGGATGTITLSGAQVASSLSFAVNEAATLSGGTSLTIGGSGTRSGIFVNAGDNATNIISSPLILNSASTALNFSNAGQSLLTIGAVTGSAVTGSQTLTVGASNLGGITLNNIIGNGAGGGNVGLTINSSGLGITSLTGANTYTGAVSVNSGVLNIQHATALGTIAGGVSVASGASLQIQGSITVGAEALALSGAGFNNNGALRSISGNNTYAGLVTLGSSTSIYSDTAANTLTLSNTGTITGAGSNLTAGGVGNITISSNIDTTSGGLTKVGSGTLTLTGINNYNGNTRVNAGTLQFNRGESLYNYGFAATWTKDNIIVERGATMAFLVANNLLQFSTADINTLLALSDSASNGFMSGSILGLDTTAGNYTYNSVIANTNSGANVLGLTKLGTNTLTLDQANTYTGGTTISAGTLQIGNGGTTGSLSANSVITNNGTLTINRSDAVAQGTDFSAAPITGTGAFIKLGAGTTTLNAANTFSGLTTVSAGVLNLTNERALQNSAIVTTGSGTVTFNGFTTPVLGGLSGATGNLSTIFPGFASTTALSLSGTAGSFTYGGIISDGAGAMTLTKNGASTQILSGANTYTGATIVNAGTLTLGSGATGSLDSSSTLQMGGGIFNFSRTGTGQAQTVNGLTVSAGNSTVNNTSTGTILTLGAITRTPSIYGTVNFATMTGAIKTTTGNTNTILGPWATTGSTTTLRYAVGSPDGTTSTGIEARTGTTATAADLSNVTDATGNFEYSAAATTASNLTANTLRYSGAATTTAIGATNTLTLNGLMNAGTGTLTLSGGPTTGGIIIGSTNELDIIANAQATTISARIADGSSPGSLVYSGGGTLTLSGTNLYTGGTVINAGKVDITTAASIGSGPITINTGGTLQYYAGPTLNRNLTLNGGTLMQYANTFSGPITLAANSNIDSSISNGSTATISGAISGPGGFTTTGGGGLLLTGANTYTGPTVINKGSAVFKSSLYSNDTSKWTPANITVASNAILGMSVGGAGEFSMAQAATMFTNLTTGVNNNGMRPNSFMSLDTRNASAGTYTYSAALTDSTGPGGGAVNFEFNGTATTTLELTGTNTYSGATMVRNNGTLRVSSLNSVFTNPTLGTVHSASSSLGAPTTIDNGTIRLGESNWNGNQHPGTSYKSGNLTYTGTGETTDRVLFLGGYSGNKNYTLDQSGTGLLKFTSNFDQQIANTHHHLILAGSTTGTGEIAGTIIQAWNGGLAWYTNVVKNGSGTWTLSGANTYAGVTTVTGGALVLNHATAIPGGIGATGGLSPLTFNGGVIGLGVGNFSRPLAAANTVNSVNFAGNGGWAAYGADRTVNLGGASAPITWATANTGLSARTLILGNATSTHTVDFQNPLDMTNAARTVQVDDGAAAIDGKLSGAITGIANGNLTKTGTGTLALSGTNNYVGTTTVSAGTLLIDGAKTGTGLITVASGAILGGTGSIAGATTFSTGGKAVFTVTRDPATQANTTPRTIAGVMAFNSTVVQLNLPANLPAGTYTLATSSATPTGTVTATPEVVSGSYATGFTSAVVSLDTANKKLLLTVNGLPTSPTKLAITSVNGGASPIAGESFDVVVQAQDANSDRRFVLVDTAVTISLNTGAGGLGGTITGTIPAGSSSVTISGVTLGSAESGVVLTAASTSGDSLTAGDSVPFTVQPSTAPAYLAVTGFPSPQTAGAAGSLTVTAMTRGGATATTYTGTVTFTSSAVSAGLPANYTFVAGDNGVKSFSGVTLNTVGTQSITATDTLTSSITGTQAAITVNAATAASLVVAGYPSPRVTGLADSVTVTAKDAYGNTDTAFVGTVQLTSSDSAAILPASHTFTGGEAGVYVFSGVTLNTLGVQSITATDTVTRSISGTQSGITVWAPPTSFTWRSAGAGNWSDATKWAQASGFDYAPITTGQADYALNFITGTYTATQNLSAGFLVNQLNFAGAVTLDGSNSLALSGTLPTINQNSTSAVTISTPLSLAANTAIGGSGNGQVSLSGVISGTGSLTKNGTSTLTLNTTNTYTGGTVINGGSVIQTNLVDGVFGTGSITLNNGASVQFSRQNDGVIRSTNQWIINSGTFSGGNGFGDWNHGAITLNGQLTIDTATTGNRNLIGIISGAGSILKTGAGGQLVLNGANTYSGGTTHQGGTLGLGHANALGTGTLVMDGTTQTLGAEANLNVGTGVTNNIVLSKDCTVRLWGSWPPADFDMRLSGTISGSGGMSLTGGYNVVNKTLFLSGTNTYTGATTISSGRLTIDDGSIASSSSIVNNAALEYKLNTNAGTYANVISGTGTLTKTGTNTLTLSGANTYTGVTTVSAGTLAVTGTLGATAVSVNAGTLAGSGNIGGNVTIASGASHALAVAATADAQVTRAITGTLTLTAGNILDLTAAATPANGVYVLATATTAITGSPTTINYNGITGGTISVDNASSPKRLLLTVAGSPYDTWANGSFANAFTAKLPGENQDGDSLTNLQEFAFGTQPTDSTGEIVYSGETLTTPGAPKLVVGDDGTYSMVFGRRADYVAAGLTYTVQFSADLVTWVDNDDVANAPAQVATDNTIDVMSVTYPATIVTQSGTPNPKFSRVKVVLAAP
jgi:autotransporter-associated beta strand protein